MPKLIRREQVHRRHELVVGFVLLPDGFLECRLVLLAFESHLVINLLEKCYQTKKADCFLCRTLIRRPSSKHRLYCLGIVHK